MHEVTAVGVAEWKIGVDGDGDGAGDGAGAEVGRVAEGSGGFEVEVDWGEAGVSSGTVGTDGAGSSTAGVVSGMVSGTAS